uniref:Neuropeptide Y receptor type 4-2-like n=1 Tax=Geotrypetes seraphini TaxID=260995 RepID=A0A6P8REA4_GEOSA|nr:neuropeptide Y receptor type 4-2-like [Geotrypetes seraphini]XP_033799156.1 neuropeptide Y receptor type 4-2-like [Geotrypetes seraphini]
MNSSRILPMKPSASFIRNNSIDFLPSFFDRCENTTDLTPLLGVSYSIVTIIGLLGNICLIFVITRQKEKANVTNILIASLSFSDTMVCIFCLPFTIVYTIMDYWVFGEIMCKMNDFIQCMSVTVSILSLVLIALERHQLIINPTGWKPSSLQAYLAVVAIWLLACFISLPYVIFSVLTDQMHKKLSSIADFYADKAICIHSWPSEHHRVMYMTSLLILQYCIPLFFITVCYLRIYLRLQKRKDIFQKTEYNSRMTNMKKINVMLASMVAAFAICWLPLNIFNSIYDWNHEIIGICYYNLIFSLSHLLAMVSICINPIIYGFLNSNFKKEVKSVIQSCKWRAPISEEYEHFPLSTMQSEVSKGSLQLNSGNSPAQEMENFCRTIHSRNNDKDVFSSVK